MIKIGVIGTGHLGKIHLNLIKEIPDFQLIGFFDIDKEKSAQVSRELGVKAFDNPEKLFQESDAIDIVSPTLTHYHYANHALENKKHIFIEKPLTHTLEEAKKLFDSVSRSKVTAQVGHVERFNPAFMALASYEISPMFIESHRLAQFNPRGTDVSVILDLMIHDIDIALHLVKSKVKDIHASGVGVVTETPDIANARIEFENGCVANLTASRISLKNMRKMRFFQRDAYISVDFLEKRCEVFMLKSGEETSRAALQIALEQGDIKKNLIYESPAVPAANAIKTELEEFANAIQNNHQPPVTLEDGYRALETAYMILEKMKTHSLIEK